MKYHSLHLGIQTGLPVLSVDASGGGLFKGNVFVLCRARRISLIAASTESVPDSRLILLCGWGAGGGGVAWVPPAWRK